MRASDFTKIKVCNLSRIKKSWDYVEVLRNLYWVVTKDNCCIAHLDKNFMCWKRAEIAERQVINLKKYVPDIIEIKFIELVYVPLCNVQEVKINIQALNKGGE